MDVCVRESTNSDLGDHGDQLETSQLLVRAFGDLGALYGALWHSHRSPRIAYQWNGGMSR